MNGRTLLWQYHSNGTRNHASAYDTGPLSMRAGYQHSDAWARFAFGASVVEPFGFQFMIEQAKGQPDFGVLIHVNGEIKRLRRGPIRFDMSRREQLVRLAVELVGRARDCFEHRLHAVIGPVEISRIA